jgi:hypothetical protein
MTATTLASSTDVAAIVSLRAARILADPPNEEHPGTSLLQEPTASWQSRSHVVERRREHRFPCDLAALLEPADGQGNILLDGPKLRVRLKDIAHHGVGIVHHEPIPYRLVLMTLETREDQTIRLLARLRWCRFKESGVYESGGQIVRVLGSGDGLQGLCAFHGGASPTAG